MFIAKSLRSWNLNANDLEATIEFYKTVLGATETPRMSIQGVSVAHLKIGDQVIGVFDASAGPRPGVPHHTFTLEGPDDSADLVKELEGRGIKVLAVRPHAPRPGYSLYVEDPNENRLELSVEP
jgi:predicted enzyme related to lactoylglutathione lyase